MKASGTVEIVLALSLFMLFGTFIIGALTYSISTTKIPNTQKQAISYASEGLEIVRYIRKSSLANLPNGTYGLLKVGNEWTLQVAASETISSTYSRIITITAPSASEKLVNVAVNWNEGGRTGSESVMAILSNWQDAIVSVIPPWTTPVFNKYHPMTATTYDVTYLKFFDGTLYTALRNGNTATYFSSFIVTAFPAIVQGTTVSAVVVDTDVAHRYSSSDTQRRFYYSSATNNGELRQINAVTRAYVGAYDLSGNVDSNGIDAFGNNVFVTRTLSTSANTPEFLILANSGTNAYSVSGSLEYTAGTLYDVLRWDANYAFVTSSAAAGELVRINITNLAAPVLSGTAINLGDAVTGRYNMTRSGNTLILYKSTGTMTNAAVYFYDCTNPLTPILRAAYAFPYLVYDVDVDTARSLLFIVSANNLAEIDIINFSTITAPVRRGLINAATSNKRSVAWDSINDRIYVGTTDNTNEIEIYDAE